MQSDSTFKINNLKPHQVFENHMFSKPYSEMFMQELHLPLLCLFKWLSESLPMCAFILSELMVILTKERCETSSAKRQHTCGLVASELGQECKEQDFIPIIASHSGILS